MRPSRRVCDWRATNAALCLTDAPTSRCAHRDAGSHTPIDKQNWPCLVEKCSSSMVLVLVLCVLVIGAVGAVLGAVLAYYLPRAVLFVVWGTLAASAVYFFLMGRTVDEYERISANMLVFAVLVPLLIGSLITGNLVRHRTQQRPVRRPD